MAPIFSIAFGNILSLLNDVTANDGEINYYCFFFLLIAVVASTTAFLYNFSFGVVGDRLVFDMRLQEDTLPEVYISHMSHIKVGKWAGCYWSVSPRWSLCWSDDV
jgi:hypothetical protein